jgi:hypothetical protein
LLGGGGFFVLLQRRSVSLVVDDLLDVLLLLARSRVDGLLPFGLVIDEDPLLLVGHLSLPFGANLFRLLDPTEETGSDTN